MAIMASDRRDHLIATAVDLFRRHGYHATGIDRIIAEAGVAKMTLYRHFRSKEELILAALRRWDEESRHWLVREIESRESDPAKRLLVLFDVLDEWFDTPEFSGCMFINATAEYPDVDDAVHRVAAEHKRLFRDYLLEQARAADVDRPEKLVDATVLLMEGAIVVAQVSGASGSGARARDIMKTLLTSKQRTLRKPKSARR